MVLCSRRLLSKKQIHKMQEAFFLIVLMVNSNTLNLQFKRCSRMTTDKTQVVLKDLPQRAQRMILKTWKRKARSLVSMAGSMPRSVLKT